MAAKTHVPRQPVVSVQFGDRFYIAPYAQRVRAVLPDVLHTGLMAGTGATTTVGLVATVLGAALFASAGLCSAPLVLLASGNMFCNAATFGVCLAIMTGGMGLLYMATRELNFFVPRLAHLAHVRRAAGVDAARDEARMQLLVPALERTAVFAALAASLLLRPATAPLHLHTVYVLAANYGLMALASA